MSRTQHKNLSKESNELSDRILKAPQLKICDQKCKCQTAKISKEGCRQTNNWHHLNTCENWLLPLPLDSTFQYCDWLLLPPICCHFCINYEFSIWAVNTHTDTCVCVNTHCDTCDLKREQMDNVDHPIDHQASRVLQQQQWFSKWSDVCCRSCCRICSWFYVGQVMWELPLIQLKRKERRKLLSRA